MDRRCFIESAAAGATCFGWISGAIQWERAERAAYGMTMIGYCDGGAIQWT